VITPTSGQSPKSNFAVRRKLLVKNALFETVEEK